MRRIRRITDWLGKRRWGNAILGAVSAAGFWVLRRITRDK